MATKIQLRRATSAQWTAANPVLAAGEPGVETDTGFMKFGDGATTWVNLQYYAMRSPSVASPGPGASVTLAVSALSTTRAWTLNANLTIAALPTPASNLSGTITLILKQPATGGPYTVTWPAIVWAEGAPPPAMPTAANSELVVHLFWTGQAWRGLVGGTFFP